MKAVSSALAGRGPEAAGTFHDRNVLVLTYWASGDALISRYTLPYVRMIRDEMPARCRVTLVTFDPPGAARRDLSEERIDHVALRYDRFGLWALARRPFDVARLAYLCVRRPIGVIHAWALPAGAIAWVLSIATRRPLVIDSFEPHADSMVENGSWEAGSFRYRLLLALERAQTRRASAAIAVTAGMANYSRERYGAVPPEMYVKPACVDLDQFSPPDGERATAPRPADADLVGVYAGKFGGIYLATEAFRLMAILGREFGPGLRFLLLTPTPAAEVEAMAAEAGLEPGRFAAVSVEPREVPAYLRAADFAINTVRPVPTKRYCTSIKDGEYWACGLPVLITEGISDDSDIVRDNRAGAVIDPVDDQGFRRAARRLRQILEEEPVEQRRARVRKLASEYRGFGIARAIYRDLYGASGPDRSASTAA